MGVVRAYHDFRRIHSIVQAAWPGAQYSLTNGAKDPNQSQCYDLRIRFITVIQARGQVAWGIQARGQVVWGCFDEVLSHSFQHLSGYVGNVI